MMLIPNHWGMLNDNTNLIITEKATFFINNLNENNLKSELFSFMSDLVGFLKQNDSIEQGSLDGEVSESIIDFLFSITNKYSDSKLDDETIIKKWQEIFQ